MRAAAAIWALLCGRGAAGAAGGGACDVRRRGAAGDNATDDTAAFAAVILDPACRTIDVPPGAYLIKPLPSLRDGTELVLRPGAVLQGWRDPRSWPNATRSYYAQWGQDHHSCFAADDGLLPGACRAAPLLRADGVDGVTLRGGGAIDGSGPQLWYNTTTLCDPTSPTYAFSYNFWHLARPLLFTANAVTNFRAHNVSLLNGPYIHMGMDGVNVSLSHLTVSTAAWQCLGYYGAPNTDCVDLSGRNIHVTDSYCHNGDDCWPLLPSWANYSARGSKPPPDAHHVGVTANVLIERSTCACGNGVRVMPGIGAPRFGVIENVTYRDITNINTSSAIRVAALAKQRGAVRNITFERFTLSGVRGNAVNIDAYGQGAQLRGARGGAPAPCGPGTPPSPLPGSCMLIDGLTIRDVSGDADKAGQILCGAQCSGLRMERVHIRANASRCCDDVATGVRAPGSCYWSTCVGPRADPDFSGYNCSGSACGGCANTARGSALDCSPRPCLRPEQQ